MLTDVSEGILKKLALREEENTVSISLYLGTLLSVPFSRGVGGFKRNIQIES